MIRFSRGIDMKLSDDVRRYIDFKDGFALHFVNRTMLTSFCSNSVSKLSLKLY